MAPFQIWLVRTLADSPGVSAFMRTDWGWPAMETLHFIGLTLLVGTIGALDLRLLGLARRIPIAALHRMVPWGVLGFAVNVATGSMFLMTEPNQYIYNPAFHLKLVFMALAGLNVLAFYVVVYRTIVPLGPGAEAPRPAKVVAALSLALWIAVIVSGRLITFYRPGGCEGQPAGLLATCIP
jgi:hypothetical protein